MSQMTDLAPSELLIRAAYRVREMAVKAPGPWVNIEDGWCIRSEPTPDRRTWTSVCGDATEGAIPWLTTMSPEIAGNLAELLLALVSVAQVFERKEITMLDSEEHGPVAWAVDLATQIMEKKS